MNTDKTDEMKNVLRAWFEMPRNPGTGTTRSYPFYPSLSVSALFLTSNGTAREPSDRHQ